MINQKKKEEVKNFFDNLSNIQPDYGKDIGLIIVREETLGDLKGLTPNSNLSSTFDLSSDTYIAGFLEDLAKNLGEGRFVFVRIHEHLDPAVYNQLYLISQTGRMDLFSSKKDDLMKVSDKAMLVLVFSDDELENLNYKNIFDIVGPVLRIH